MTCKSPTTTCSEFFKTNAIGGARLHLITNQSRFLILEPIANLASRTLSLLAKRVVKDWPVRFGHPVLLMETFVDPQRFAGTCYRAENWIQIGQTAGYRRQRRGYRQGSSPKLMFVRPLRSDARRLLGGAHLDSHYFPKGVCRKMYTDADFKSLLDYFSHIEDPRGRRGRRYRLGTLLAIAAAATVCGARGYQEMGEWVQAQSEKVLRHFRVGLRRGKVQRPSVYCIREALVRTDPGQFDDALRKWCISIDGCDEAIAIDGKTMKGAVDGNNRQIHVLGACGHQSRMHLAKKKMRLDSDGSEEQKYTNEIGACIPLLKSIDDLNGKVITADALLTQHAIASYILSRGGHYMFILKNNQKDLTGEVSIHFTDLLRLRPDTEADFVTRTGDATDAGKKVPKVQHGRHEIREIRVSDNAELMAYLNRESKFPDIAQIFRIRRTIDHYRRGEVTKTTQETVVGITSLQAAQADPKTLLGLNRGHWTIESNHRILDDSNTWHEDHLLIRTGHGPENVTALRRFAISVIRRHAESVAPTMRKLRTNARLLLDYLGLAGNTRRRGRRSPITGAVCR